MWVTDGGPGGGVGVDFLYVYGSDDADNVHLNVVDGDARVEVGVGATTGIVHYNAGIERLIVDTQAGDDTVLLDDNIAETEVYLGAGKDTVTIGTVVTKPSVRDASVPVVDLDKTSAGVSNRTQVFGGTGNDEFEINYNKAEIWLYGETGDDLFIINTFLVDKAEVTEEKLPKGKNMLGGEGNNTYDARTGQKFTDELQFYAFLQSANVNIDGGPGIDTIVFNGTPLNDVFAIAKNYVAGAGRFLNFENIERLEINGGDGDDEFYVVSTSANLDVTVRGGSGKDTIHMGGDKKASQRDLPEFQYTPDPILRQDPGRIYQNLVNGAWSGSYSYDTTVPFIKKEVVGNTAWYWWYWPSYASLNSRFHSDFRAGYLQPYPQGVPPSDWHIQSSLNVAGYQGFTFDSGVSPSTDFTNFINSGTRITNRTDQFVAWDNRAWNDHVNFLARTTGNYSVDAFSFHSVNTWYFQTYYQQQPPKLTLDPKAYYIDEDRVDNLAGRYSGRLHVDGGADDDRFVVQAMPSLQVVERLRLEPENP